MSSRLRGAPGLLLLLALALAGGCSRGPCVRHTDCAPAGVCTIEGGGAAPPDAGAATDGGDPGDATDAPGAPADAPGAPADAPATPGDAPITVAAERGGR